MRRPLWFRRRLVASWLFLLLGGFLGVAVWLFANRHTQAAEPQRSSDKTVDNTASKPADHVPAGFKRLSPESEVWFSKERGQVLVDGEVCLREGELEMLACPKNTKEHEAIVAVKSKAFILHAALLAVGAKPGNPVKFLPEYQAATGTQVDISVEWTDPEGKTKQAKAQDWILDGRTKKPMTYVWVFGGSSFWKDDAGKEHYFADSGDLICVSNFPSAMLDLPVKSSSNNDELLFHANTEKIPPKGTKVRLTLTPKLDRKDAATTLPKTP